MPHRMALPLQRSARTVGGSRLPATGRTLLNNVCRDQISRQQRSGTYASSGRNEHGEAHETAAVTKRQLLAGVGALALPAIPAAQPALADSAPGTSSKSTRVRLTRGPPK